jgi:hypothetical protein
VGYIPWLNTSTASNIGVPLAGSVAGTAVTPLMDRAIDQIFEPEEENDVLKKLVAMQKAEKTKKVVEGLLTAGAFGSGIMATSKMVDMIRDYNRVQAVKILGRNVLTKAVLPVGLLGLLAHYLSNRPREASSVVTTFQRS